MKRFFLNMGRGYMMIVEPFNVCWSYLFSCEWRHSNEDTLYALALLVMFLILTPFAYLCVAPIVALLWGFKDGGETCL